MTKAEYREAFITAAEDIDGITSKTEMARRLSLLDPAKPNGLADLADHVVVEFRMRSDGPFPYLAAPFGETGRFGPGYIPGGRTLGNAREWVIDNRAAGKGLIDLGTIVIRPLPRP